MHNSSKIIISCFLLLLLVFVGCIKRPPGEPEPQIKFEKILIQNDSGIVVISFTDGDGDVGLDVGDTIFPWNIDGDNYYNLRLDLFEKINGNWEKFNFPNGSGFNYRIPRITPEGASKAIKGEIEVVLYPYYNAASSYDTIKYQIFLEDRALNLSNALDSPIIVAP